MPDTTAPLAPMTPHAAISAFSYLRAVQGDDVEAAREFTSTEPRMAELLVDVVERIVVPVTMLPDPEAGEPSTETFALEALGRVLVASLRTWAQAGPDAAEGIARSVVDFVVQFLTDDHEDVAEVLRQLEAVGVGQAIAAHPAPAGSHPVRLSIV
ncbi:hypothetical protein [Streptomyces sp. NPDC023588]|uniref:hypothetical protein n=1 Tax=Streptomyces sp. NPDC023588 TaxID=3154907 RepID=UPI0033C06160